MATKLEFYSRIHLYDNLTVSVFHFHFPFLVSISTVSNCPTVYPFGLWLVLLIISTTLTNDVRFGSVL